MERPLLLTLLPVHYNAAYSCAVALPTYHVFLQVKKDYLEGGAMADTADLVVLGAYYGTGSKGGHASLNGYGCHVIT